jgi:4-hydroxy-4-methyl-2-oxoglutarate aldolase
MSKFDYSDTNWEAIRRLSRWYSGDIHDCLNDLGIHGHLKGIRLFGSLADNQTVCGPAVTVQFVPSTRRNQPQDVYHNAIDNVPQNGVLVVESSCAEGSCTGELMCSGAKTHGAAATVVNGTVRDIAQVRALGYPLFALGLNPVGPSGKLEPAFSQVPVSFGGVTICPGDVIFGDLNGVVVIPKYLVGTIADAADACGEGEGAARDRILAGERLQAIWPAK